MRFFLATLFTFWGLSSWLQTTITIYPDTLQGLVPITAKPGVFYVPKTLEGAEEFNTNGIYQNSIRTHIIESALNNAENLEECLALLESVETELVALSEKCEKMILIFEKMPAWLSSSADGSPAGTPGWYVLNTKRPADWAEWEEAVTAITALLVNDFGIDNAWFEVWNEPDLGSWTGTMTEYFELYEHTYNAVKSVNENIYMGGPASNFWANNIYWHPSVGHIPDAVADSSLVAELLNYGLANACLPDFLSWHNFNLTHQEFERGATYVRQKCENLAISVPPLLISEWNAPSAVRETPVHKSFVVKGQQEIMKAALDYQMIAAWQDFEEEPGEFHSDYGLLTWGGVHKPAYYATLMFNEMEGALCKTQAADPYVLSASAFEDTLYLVLANYCPPPFIEAFNHTLYEGGFNINQLDSAGFIDIETGDISYLESIYNGDVTIADESPLHAAINASISVYTFYATYESTPRIFTLNLHGFSDDYAGSQFLVDDEVNNNHFRYDSLQVAGYSRADAVDFLLANQSLGGTSIAFTDGSTTLTLDPNAILLIKLGVSGVGGVIDPEKEQTFQVYPNPANDILNISMLNSEQTLQIFSLDGKCVKTISPNVALTISIADLAPGTYFIGSVEGGQRFQKFVKR